MTADEIIVGIEDSPLRPRALRGAAAYTRPTEKCFVSFM
jgi:hypothetical protein